MGMMDKMMGIMMGRMSREEKEAMMNHAMDKMMGGMPAEEKQNMMAEMMPKMMDGVNMIEEGTDGLRDEQKTAFRETIQSVVDAGFRG